MLATLLTVVGTAPLVRAQQDLTSAYPLGELIGEGGNKRVYAVQGRLDLVVRVSKRAGHNGFDGEHNTLHKLDKLAQWGLPTPRVMASGTHRLRSGGQTTYSADVMERYAVCSKDSCFRKQATQLFNAQSVRDLDRMRDAITRHNIGISDLQFLVSRTGRVVITDPITAYPGGGARRGNLRTIAGLRDLAQQAIDRRQRRRQPASTPRAPSPKRGGLWGWLSRRRR